MKKKQILNIIIVIIGILLITFGVIHFITNNKDNKRNVKEILVDNKVLEVSSKLVSMYKTDIKTSFYVYQDKKVTLDSIDESIVIGSALNSLSTKNIRSCNEEEIKNNPDCDLIVEKSVIQEKVKQLYGDKYSNLPKKIVGHGSLSCSLVNNNYECLNHDNSEEPISNEFTAFFGEANYINIKKIIKAEEDEENIYVYEKYINLRLVEPNEMDYNNINAYNYRVYRYSNSNDLLTNDTLVGKKLYENKDVTIEKQIYEIYKDKASTFMHTFKKLNDDKYLYVSTEEVK